MKKIILIILLILYFIVQVSHAQIPSDSLPMGPRIEGTLWDDLDNDGDVDFAGNNSYGISMGVPNAFSIVVRMNNGDGTFGQPLYNTYTPSGQSQWMNSNAHDVASYDIDRNGLKDLIANGYYDLVIFYQTSPGVFSPMSVVNVGTATIENFAVDSLTGMFVLSHWFPASTPKFFTIGKVDSAGNFIFTQIFTPTRVQDFQFENDHIFGRGDYEILEYDTLGNIFNTYPLLESSTAYDVTNNHISVAIGQVWDQTLVEFIVGNTTPVKNSLILSPVLVQSMRYIDWDNDGVFEHFLMRNNEIEILPSTGTGIVLSNTYSFPIHMHALQFADVDNDGENEFSAPYYDISTQASGLHIFGGLVVTTGVEPEPVIEQKEEVSITVYPNPTTDFLQISNVEENTQFKVVSLNGDVALSGSGSIINVGSLTKGIYIVQILDNKNNVSRRFTKL